MEHVVQSTAELADEIAALWAELDTRETSYDTTGDVAVSMNIVTIQFDLHGKRVELTLNNHSIDATDLEITNITEVK